MTQENVSGAIVSRKDYASTPEGQYNFWTLEMEAARKRLRHWRKQSNDISRRYVDDRVGSQGTDIEGRAGKAEGAGGMFRLNIFHSNIKTVMDMLYGQLPRVDVSRVDHTGNDDIARVAAEMMERMLRIDVQNNGETYSGMFHSTLQDRLLGGLGCTRVRYSFSEEEIKLEEAMEVDDDDDDDEVEGNFLGSEGGEEEVEEEVEEIYESRITDEQAPTDYVYWDDILWGWCRNYTGMPWQGFRSYLSKDEVTKRFGEKAGNDVQLKQQGVNQNPEGVTDPDMSSAWQKAEIWEIWDKASKKVIWVSPGTPYTLDTKDDTLQLRNFFPAPEFFLANATNTLYVPTPDFHMAQDLYNEIDVLQTRVAILTEAVKVVGVYDAAADGIKRMFKEGIENDLIPVDNWALFAEKGGIQGSIDWVPIVDVVNALNKLIEVRDQTIQLLQQVTGMSDIMRGQLDNQYEGVGQTQEKAKFGSARIQALQDEFAGFIANLMQLKAEVICKHFSPETIFAQSNMEFSPDRDKAGAAIEMMKKGDTLPFRVKIQPETMAMQDYAQLQQERAAYLNGLSTFIQSATPLIQQDPRSLPFLLQMLKWAMAGFKGSSEIEGVLDQAIETMSQPEEQQEKPDPEQAKAQQAAELQQTKHQNALAEDAQKHSQALELRLADQQADIITREAEIEMEAQANDRATQNELRVIGAKMEADVQKELLTSQINAEQQAEGIEAQTKSDIIQSRLKIEEMVVGKKIDAGVKIIEIASTATEKQKDRDLQLVQSKPDAVEN
jgi:hypothetical protein